MKQIDEAWKSSRPKPSELEVTESLKKWASCHEWTKDGGQYAQGAHIWIKKRRWETEPMATPTGKKHAGTTQMEILGNEF